MSTTGIPTQLESALNAYRTNYAAFKVTGNSAHKTAYEKALEVVNQTINNSRSVTEGNDRYISNFIGEYQNANPELVTLQQQSRKIQQQGPKLQDELARSRQIHQRAAAELDETGLYVKAGIVVGLLIVVGIVGSL
jgi:DNA repair exonuclease SbcCD ATPase subunit